MIISRKLTRPSYLWRIYRIFSHLCLAELGDYNLYTKRASFKDDGILKQFLPQSTLDESDPAQEPSDISEDIQVRLQICSRNITYNAKLD
ncbi:hypothetical protein Ciccas_001167 [Cichlidogyrus casuarinus]|uniref:Uncharacterized protein n=1 Tax=Cichlidogyrus casuarinus TaxID=1844966 RepID=A0ABD2QL16_9PLAT